MTNSVLTSSVPAAEALGPPVPFIDLVAQQAEIQDEISPEIAEALRRADFIGGKHVAAFEADFAAFTSVTHCIGVGNGTDALELALRALDIVEGREVLVPVNSFIASAEAVLRAGATVRFADVDDDSLLLDRASVESAITNETAAVMAVHLYGQPAPVDQILSVADRYGAVVIEDAAQSQGACRNGRPAGSLSRIAATSFYPGKNLGAAGDGGAVLTSDDDLAARVRRIASHGSTEKYVHDEFGFNSRLDSIQAIVLRAKLARLEAWNAARRAAARRYDVLIADVDGVRAPVTLAGNVHNWHIYSVRVEDRDRILAGLHAEGIGAALHYPTPIHLTGAFRHLGLARGDFPVAERAAAQLLSLPMFPHLTEAQQVRVVDALKRLV
ncbi:DegT/DnrJ/EryC1/StrS family aminotransferase [Cryobacterium algoritolerans]|uniref:DegT/DnrJ/EryC1/StrS family aminotransferase n=1 Tax=Cryobacterium algoritolerans TaxID=1259184 RepID=A0A4R8WZQ7_9MICO|nr:DegT/DnrJ/EryC1/StrS family aminotransferase [Cryobacterium algoritolerans]TFC19825.1 DegT/DnrJ/EryC1/StrS family aminotransferase [Cryobacterium algoritolerans]